MLRIKSACVVVAFTGLFSASAYAEQCEGPNGNCGAAPIEASNDTIVAPVSFGEKPLQLADASQAQTPTLSERVAARRASPRSRGGSVYGGFGNQVFATAGAVFAAEDDNADLDALGLSGTFGYRHRIGGARRSVVWVQPTGVYFRDTQRQTITGIELRDTFTGIGGLIALGYGYQIGPVMPFATVGAGPLRLRTEIDDGIVDLNSSELTVGYAGSAGFQTKIIDDLSLEVSYRYLGSVRDDVLGFHSVEAGVAYRF
ncbi:MAG: outer membrane beta-barrel protein [Pseudomonadota bacterium]